MCTPLLYRNAIHIYYHIGQLHGICILGKVPQAGPITFHNYNEWYKPLGLHLATLYSQHHAMNVAFIYQPVALQ